MRRLLCTALALACAFPAAAQEAAAPESLAAAILRTREDILAATTALNAWRDDVAEQRMPLTRRLEGLQAEVQRLRGETRRRREARMQGQTEREALASRVERLEEECRFVQTLLSEYRRSLETRAGRAESQWLTARLRPADRQLTDEEDFSALPEAVGQLLALAADWNTRRLGGMRFEGHALDEAGVEHAGRFAVLGPASYFAAADGRVAGLAVARVGSTQPSVFSRFDEEAAAARVARLVAGEEAAVPVDVTLGDAMRMAETRESLSDHVRKGGVVIFPLLAVGAVAVFLMIAKSVSLARIRVPPGPALDAIADAAAGGRAAQALEAADEWGEPLAPILREGVKHADAPAERLEEILSERVSSAVPQLERHLQTLAVLGAVAPLLGLLGTVTGMIHTFQLVTIFGSGDARLLSGGISEALVTTEVGLVIAVPVLLVHAFLTRRVRVLVAALEDTVAGFVHRLKR